MTVYYPSFFIFMDDLKLIKERFLELSERAVQRYLPISTDFLTLFEQTVLKELKISCLYKLYGGTELSERKICVFYPEDYDENKIMPPAEFIKISPKNDKFAEKKTHRDFLGTILNLGIKREMIGDIYLTKDNKSAFVYVHNKMTEYICSNLNRIGNVAFFAVKSDRVDNCKMNFKIKLFTFASKRVDLIIADIFNISRNNSKRLFSEDKIFINGRLCKRAEKLLEKDDIISVRGFGKFKIKDEKGISKKGKIKLEIEEFV